MKTCAKCGNEVAGPACPKCQGRAARDFRVKAGIALGLCGLVLFGVLVAVLTGGGKKRPAALVGPAKREAVRQARIARARASLCLLTDAATAYHADKARWPATLADLTVSGLQGKPALLQSRDLVDPWLVPYQYDPSGPKNGGSRPDIWTVTPDGEAVGNWEK